MWRIYSSDRQGIMIETTFKEFNLIDNLRNASLSRIIYFSKNNYIEKRKEVQNNISYSFAGDMALKREAFSHEKEVRLLVCLQDYQKEINDIWNIPVVGFDVNPEDFIKSITIDPRADNWFVDTMKKYCDSKKLKCPIEKSSLYKRDFFETAQLIRKWEIVNK